MSEKLYINLQWQTYVMKMNALHAIPLINNYSIQHMQTKHMNQNWIFWHTTKHMISMQNIIVLKILITTLLIQTELHLHCALPLGTESTLNTTNYHLDIVCVYAA